MFFQNGADLYYEVHGQGEPLVLIAGLTAHSGNWPAQLPAFAGKRKTILIDNRNSGRSAVTEDGSVPAMADPHAQTTQGFKNQVQAIRSHDTRERLDQISAPCLVIAGAEDLLIPVEEQKTLLEGTPDTRWLCLQGSGHGVHADQAERFNNAVPDFLA
ncbi:MAG: alpha/beta hydrolase [Desulfobacterales bacterium]|nr:alpha/beta hydrolase [Desulfobacterales bacterium]